LSSETKYVTFTNQKYILLNWPSEQVSPPHTPLALDVVISLKESQSVS